MNALRKSIQQPDVVRLDIQLKSIVGVENVEHFVDLIELTKLLDSVTSMEQFLTIDDEHNLGLMPFTIHSREGSLEIPWPLSFRLYFLPVSQI
jgi:hypothetical protein